MSPQPLPEPTDNLRIVRKRPWYAWLLGYWPVRGYTCGHVDWKYYELDVYGAAVSFVSPDDKCPHCVLLAARRDIIRCAACGRPILPCHPVVLYNPEKSDLRPGCITYADDQRKGVLGCVRDVCCPPAPGLIVGYWGGAEDGFIPKD